MIKSVLILRKAFRLELSNHFLRRQKQTYSSRFFTLDTIYALSSGINSAISVLSLQLERQQEYVVLRHIAPLDCLSNEEEKDALLLNSKIKPRVMTLKNIYSSENLLIDRALVVFFTSSHSYNKEDIFQLHVHGSKAVIKAIFKQLALLDFRIAERGQFTKRAVMNGKITIHEAEAINDLVNSERQFERQVAVDNLLGKNVQWMKNIRTDLISVLAHLQAFINFGQDESSIPSDLFINLKINIKKIDQGIRKIISCSKMLMSVRQGVNIIILGAPNVGKSTLINGLSQRKVSIVNKLPGTTRDLIESSIEMDGFRLNVIDTAGIRQTNCEIEKEGIQSAINKAQESHLILALIDIENQMVQQNSQSVEILIQQESELGQIIFRQNTVVALNKSDKISSEKISKKYFCKSTTNRKPVEIKISAISQKGVQQTVNHLKHLINTKFNIYKKDEHQIFFTKTRYLQKLKQCSLHLTSVMQADLADIASWHLRQSINEVQEIIGRVDNEQILDTLFSQFCIGK